MYEINVSGIVIEVERKRIKNLRLMVYPPDGRVKIAAPLFMNKEEIKIFVITKLAWIKKHQLKYLNRPRHAEIRFATGEEHYFLGNSYTLNVIEHSKRTRVELNGGNIELYIKPGSKKIQREKAIESWYRKQLIEIAPPLIKKWEKIAGVSITQYGIKKMKTRWGSCNIRVKRIWLNLELAKRPIRSLEFIILHELVHLLERNHNNKFKAHMDGFMPEWRTYSKELKHFPFNSSSENPLP